MKRILTAAAVVGGLALSTSGLALAQNTTPPSNPPPASTAPSTTNPASNPGTTNPEATNRSETSGPSAENTQPGGAMNSPQDIRQAQEQLKAQGLYHGAVDGQMGPETKSALARFQEQNGLPQTSTLDQATMAKLGSAAGGTGNTMQNSGSSTPPAGMNPSMHSAPGNSSAGNPATGTSPAYPHSGSNPGSATPGEAPSNR